MRVGFARDALRPAEAQLICLACGMGESESARVLLQLSSLFVGQAVAENQGGRERARQSWCLALDDRLPPFLFSHVILFQCTASSIPATFGPYLKHQQVQRQVRATILLVLCKVLLLDRVAYYLENHSIVG